MVPCPDRCCQLLFGCAAVSSRSSSRVSQAAEATARLVSLDLAKVLGQKVAGNGHVQILDRQTLGAVRCPADICGVVYL